MDLAVGVSVLPVATMGEGAADVGMEGVGWVSTLTLYLLFAIMVLLLLSGTFVLALGDFLTMGLVPGWAGLSWFCCNGFVVATFVVVGLVAVGFGVGVWTWTKSPFQFQVCFHLPDEGWVRMELCAPGIALDYPGCPVPSKYVNTLHCLYFNFYVYHLHR